MVDPYSGREQTKAKHFILKRYLQALAFKVLTFADITSRRRLLGTVGDADGGLCQFVVHDRDRSVERRAAKGPCSNGKAPKDLLLTYGEQPEGFCASSTAAVAPFNKSEEDFEIKTFGGDFEDAVSEIQAFIGRSFPLIFIDPTGWTGYAFDRIRPLFDRPKCEVVINFMYDFVNRAASMSDAKTISSLDPRLGGSNWEQRLDPNLPRGRAIEKLFRETLRGAGGFEFVVSTKIDRSTADRPHFFIAYGTKSDNGLKTFQGDRVRCSASSRARSRRCQGA